MAFDIEIPKAIVTRWNAIGLDTSLGQLDPSGGTFSRAVNAILENNEEPRSAFGTPPETRLPRYEYLVDFSSVDLRTANNRIVVVPVRFNVYRENTLDCWQDSDTIATEFIDSDTAGANALSVDSDVGSIMSVTDMGGTAFPIAEGISQGIRQIEIQWKRCGTTPS